MEKSSFRILDLIEKFNLQLRGEGYGV